MFHLSNYYYLLLINNNNNKDNISNRETCYLCLADMLQCMQRVHEQQEKVSQHSVS